MKLGQGKSGVVYEMCDMKNFMSNKETFCKMVETQIQAVKHLVLYIDIDKTITLDLQSEIIAFLSELTRSKNEKLVAKVFKNGSSFTGLIQANKSFASELEGLLECEATTSGFIKYRENKIYGFSIVFKSIFKLTNEYILFYQKCSITLEDFCKSGKLTWPNLFYKIIRELLKVLVKLQEKNIAHGDIKPANIMLCSKWTLIDWNMWRKLTLENLTLKNGVIPKHRGTSPFLYKLNKFMYLDTMRKNYVDDMMMGQYFPKIRNHGIRFLNKSIDSFALVNPHDQFEQLKYSCDLHSLGLVIFAVNRLFIKHVVLDEFAARLCIYNEKMIHNAKTALYIFNKIKFNNQFLQQSIM
jgi:serine/threonine protein kinase